MAASKIISSGFYPIYIGSDIYTVLTNFLQLPHYKKSRYFVLVDKNTRKHCMESVLGKLNLERNAEVIEIPAGEPHKNIQTCGFIWNHLINHQADRHSILINIGGGVVTDMGGFAAAAFKRGIRFIHIPTTLIGQIDAAVGGKVGIDYENLKNLVGLFANPEAVFIDPALLKTLPHQHIISGYAEILKHGLIYDAAYYREQEFVKLDEIRDWMPVITRSVEIKTAIVKVDPLDRKYRKVLNFGHTIGHAMESASLNTGRSFLLHGEAIAAGMICEAYISRQRGLLTQTDLESVSTCLRNNFNKVNLSALKEDIMRFLRSDKKNEGGKLNFTLLSGIGHAVINQYVDQDLIMESLGYYQDVYNI